MARAQAGARLGDLATETLGPAGIDDVVVGQLAGGGDLRHIAHQRRLTLDGDVAVAHDGGHVFGAQRLIETHHT